MTTGAGQKFKDAVTAAKAGGQPLHVIGVADGSDALEAQKAGFKAIYLSGSQMAAARGWADIGMLELRHVIEHVERIMDSGTKLPLLVDIDTGFDDITETIQKLEKMGVAAVHVEDQQDLKMCGHLDGKHVVSKEDATERVSKAVAARKSDMVIMARTDALAVEGLDKTLERISLYTKAGADMVFAEAFEDAKTYEAVKKAAGGKPVLANMTEFGKVELLTPKELEAQSDGNVDIMLTPLSVYRAMRKLAENVYQQIFTDGTQKNLLKQLQTRPEFQSLIGYDAQRANRATALSKNQKKPG